MHFVTTVGFHLQTLLFVADVAEGRDFVDLFIYFVVAESTLDSLFVLFKLRARRTQMVGLRLALGAEIIFTGGAADSVDTAVVGGLPTQRLALVVLFERGVSGNHLDDGSTRAGGKIGPLLILIEFKVGFGDLLTVLFGQIVIDFVLLNRFGTFWADYRNAVLKFELGF